MNLKIQERDGGITIECFVAPRAKRNAIKGTRDGALAVSVQSPPIEGRANDALIEFLAKALDVPRRAISIIGGMSSRKKILLIQGITKNEALIRVAEHL